MKQINKRGIAIGDQVLLTLVNKIRQVEKKLGLDFLIYKVGPAFVICGERETSVLSEAVGEIATTAGCLYGLAWAKGEFPSPS